MKIYWTENSNLCSQNTQTITFKKFIFKSVSITLQLLKHLFKINKFFDCIQISKSAIFITQINYNCSLFSKMIVKNTWNFVYLSGYFDNSIFFLKDLERFHPNLHFKLLKLIDNSKSNNSHY